MLQSIRNTNSIGPNVSRTEPGCPVTFLLKKALAGRPKEGNFKLTAKGQQFLNG